MAQKLLNKFITFLDKNADLPFKYKKAVLDACLFSSITYASETFIGGQLKPLDTLYTRAIKCLLGVRTTTCTEICLLELNYPSFTALLLKRRSDYLKRRIPLLQEDDPLKLAINISKGANTRVYKNLMAALTLQRDPVIENIHLQRETIRAKCVLSSKRSFYVTINPDGIVHPVYALTDYHIPEYIRFAFTRLRMVSHNLRIETGRWARVDKNRRTCTCDNISVQDEHHALFQCTLTHHLRVQYKFTDFNTLFNTNDYTKTCEFIYKVLHVF